MFKHFALAAITYVCLTSAAQAQAYEPFIGEVQTFAFSFCPSGWLATNGQLLNIQDYTPLYDLIGTQYGGDGTTTFALPKTRPAKTATRAIMLNCISYLGVFPSHG